MGPKALLNFLKWMFSCGVEGASGWQLWEVHCRKKTTLTIEAEYSFKKHALENTEMVLLRRKATITIWNYPLFTCYALIELFLDNALF